MSDNALDSTAYLHFHLFGVSSKWPGRLLKVAGASPQSGRGVSSKWPARSHAQSSTLSIMIMTYIVYTVITIHIIYNLCRLLRSASFNLGQSLK